MELIVEVLENFEKAMHMLTTKHVASRKFSFIKYSPLVVLQTSELYELVDIIGASCELKNHCNDHIDSLPKSPIVKCTPPRSRVLYGFATYLI